jgi:hypothetical protein
VMVSLLPMSRHLRRRCDGVVVLVVMASLPLPMRRCLAVVDNDGDGTTGDSIEDNCDSATKVNNDNNYDGEMDDYGDSNEGDADGNGTMDDNDDDNNGDVDGNGTGRQRR